MFYRINVIPFDCEHNPLTKRAILYGLLLAAALASPAVPDARASNPSAKPAPATENDQDKDYEPGFASSYLAGRYARANGDIMAATKYLQQVYESDPDNMDIAIQLEGMLLLQGKIDEAAVVAVDIKDSERKDPIADLLLTLQGIKTHNMAQADKIIAASAGSNQLWVPLISGWVEVAEHRLAKPVTLESLSVDVKRTAPIVNYHLALINHAAGFNDAATNNFKNSVEDIQNPPSRIMGAMLHFYDEANSPEALKPLVESYRQNNPNDVAGNDAPTINSPEDGVAEVLFTMGSIMLGAGATQDATIYLQMALYMKPDLPQAKLALADSYSDLQQYAMANALYEKIPSQNLFYLRAQLRMAINYDRMGHLKEALAQLAKMSKEAPMLIDVWVAKGDLLRIHGKFPEAVEAYTQALKRIPELKSPYWPILFARGSCLERIGKWQAAERDLRQALELKPDQPDVLNYLGYGWLARNENLEEARGMIEKAVTARPNDAQIVDSMGWVLYLQGNYDQSVEYLEKAVELLPGDATVNDHLGDAYWRLGRKTEARFQWERALTFSPDAKLADTIHKKLKEGLRTTLAQSQNTTQ